MNTSSKKILTWSLLVGMVFTTGFLLWAGRHSGTKIIRNLDGSEIYLTDQVRVSDFQQISKLHIATIVDLRPDGEALDETPSAEVATISHRHGMDFAYIPVPHGDIPSIQVDKLASLLRVGKRPMLLYCRTGKRAIRTFCLAEASRYEGHTEPELTAIAKKTGFTIDDLHNDIVRRLSTRIGKGK